jgi:LysR family hydrogen peroxide-inducible transcriptional activator
MPNLRQLEYLVALADTLHFRRAAEKTNATQPTLSEQLKALECRLGAQLVERTRSRVILTPVGRQIVEIARRVLADSDEIRALAASGGKEMAGMLRLGLPPTIGPYLLPCVVSELQCAYPGLKLYVREELPSVLPRALEEGRHDVVVSLLPVRGAELVSRPLFREPLYLSVGPKHPLAQKSAARPSDLEGEDILALGPGHQLHDVVLGLCDEFGARLRLDYEGTSLDTLHEMVAMGLGITFLPALYVKAIVSRQSRIKTLELEGRSIYRTVGLIWRRSSARHASYESLAIVLRSAVRREFEEFTVLS